MKISAKKSIFLAIILIYIGECCEILFSSYSSYFKIMKYVITGVGLLICSLCITKYSQKRQYLFSKECKRILFVSAWFLLASIYFMIKSSMYTYNTILEIMQLLLPYIFAFFVINYLNFKEISYIMKFSLIVSFISYLINIDIISTINSSSINPISIFSSYSPFESSAFAEMASGISAFFIYYWKKYPGYTLISILFVFMTFKRVLMLQALLLIIVVLFGAKDKKVSTKIINFSIILAVIGTLAFEYLLRYENAQLFFHIFHTTPGEFTVTRVYRLWYQLSHFISYGFGSTTSILGYNLELDLIKILMEIGIVSLFLFIRNMFKLSNNNLYSYIVIGAIMLNLLLASCLTSTIGWISRIISIACINYIKKDQVEYNKNTFNVVKKVYYESRVN